MELITLSLYFFAMLGIGVFAYRNSTANASQYLLGGRSVSPQVTALSAGASDMSGWMLMGLPGAMFVMGYEAGLIAIGLVLGAWINYLAVAPRLRVITEVAGDALTIPEYFAKRFNQDSSSLRILSAVIIVIFFTLYTSSGLVAGGKLFESAFNLSYHTGIVVTLSIVVAYTLLGGFLAVSMTDFVQGCIMFVALVLVPFVALTAFDDTHEMLSQAQQSIAPLSSTLQGLTLVGVISSLAWGLGYFGQPHIIVRFMAIRSVNDIKVARRIGMSWMTVTIIGALSTGLVGVAYVNKFGLTLDDPETIFIVFTELLFHPLISGFLLAAILAAIMSTISSQLLVSASSLTEDIYRAIGEQTPNPKRVVLLNRIGVLAVGLVAMLLSLNANQSVLSIVSHAWAGFGAAFGPLVLFSLYSAMLTRQAAMAGVVVGAVTVLVCIYVPINAQGDVINDVIYAIIPGFVASSLTLWGVSRMGEGPNLATVALFESAIKRLKQYQ